MMFFQQDMQVWANQFTVFRNLETLFHNSSLAGVNMVSTSNKFYKFDGTSLFPWKCYCPQTSQVIGLGLQVDLDESFHATVRKIGRSREVSKPRDLCPIALKFDRHLNSSAKNTQHLVSQL